MTIEQIIEHSCEDGRFRVDGWGGVAFYLWRVETAPMVMVGDDREHSVDPDDVEMIASEDYCHECGQIGCKADGRDS